MIKTSLVHYRVKVAKTRSNAPSPSIVTHCCEPEGRQLSKHFCINPVSQPLSLQPFVSQSDKFPSKILRINITHISEPESSSIKVPVNAFTKIINLAAPVTAADAFFQHHFRNGRTHANIRTVAKDEQIQPIVTLLEVTTNLEETTSFICDVNVTPKANDEKRQISCWHPGVGGVQLSKAIYHN